MSVITESKIGDSLKAAQAGWDYITREIEASDPDVAKKTVPFLSRLYHAINRTFTGIQEQIADGAIDPSVGLRSLAHSYDPHQRTFHDIERPIRVGFFPIGGNPIWWGHLLASLMAMEALSLDTLVFRVQGEIRYKDLPETDRVPVRARHAIARELIGRFSPLIRYTDLGSEPGNDREGAEEMYHYLRLNPDRQIHIHYLLGMETKSRVERYFLQQHEAAKRHGLGSNPSHELTIGWIQRGEYGATVTREELEEVSRFSQEQAGSRLHIRSVLIQDPEIDLHVSSTYYRNTHDHAIVPKPVHEHAKAHGFYGHPPIDSRTGKPYDYSEEEHFRVRLRPVAEGIANHIVRLRERDHTAATMIVSIDGPSGSGKTTIAEEVAKYLSLRGYGSAHIPFDIFLKGKNWRSGMEKLILGEALNSIERESVGQAVEQIVPTETYLNEESFWHRDARATLVQELDAFRRSGQEKTCLVVRDGYDRQTKERRSHRFTIECGAVVLIDGKYCNCEELAPHFDVRYRLLDNPDRTKAKFEMRTRSLSPNTADTQMRFYDVGLIPSYERYAERTHEVIDCTIDLYGDEWKLVDGTPTLTEMLTDADERILTEKSV